MSNEIQKEAEENNNLLYVLHSTPIMDCISLATIARETASDKTLQKINSIYGIILMIVESQNVCFFEWCGVCIVNTAIPIVWLLIISMVDSCCVRVYSLKKWHRRHHGAAFWYFVCKCIQQTQYG